MAGLGLEFEPGAAKKADPTGGSHLAARVGEGSGGAGRARGSGRENGLVGGRKGEGEREVGRRDLGCGKGRKERKGKR